MGFGQGRVEYITRNGPGNEFNITCGPDSDGIDTARIFIEIIGHSPPPNSQIRVFVDGNEAQFYSDAAGIINIDHRAATSNFNYMWEKIREGRQMIVIFSDNRSSQFSLRGSSKTLPARPCPTV